MAGHLVAAGTLVEEDPVAALAHARAARDRASRVAAVREAVGVAAYHAEDYAEAARELRAYRRMSGDEGYRAVLADCERALGRPEVALRLVAEALADDPDPEEAVELRIVESGARLDLGEDAAARLVLEAALGDCLDPASLHPGDAARLRLASAYADLLQRQGETERATDWLVAIAGADPEDRTGAVERLGISFTDLEDQQFGEEPDVDLDTAAEDGVAAAEGSVPQPSAPEAVHRLPEDDHGLGRSFDEEVEAEVAELLGETDEPPEPPAGSGSGEDEAPAGD
ncbi:tetratricopeptide repeat protein [Blastococcus deserti]|uniref:Tetratricopeptide repeat protein n=1 Tax=Blastococcus deserti TaxID=2259033 RepID=A0ABW4XFF0_9ACTN